MKAGVVLLNFGEPEDVSTETVVPFLERIFTVNAALDGGRRSEEKIRERSRELAEQRAPGLIEEYEEIGGSPLNEQARAQAKELKKELKRREFEVETYLGMQFTEPSIRDAVEQARDDGVELLVGLPVYPLCGKTTTVAALETLAEEVRDLGWDVPLREITGWHRHGIYVELRAENVRNFLTENELDLRDGNTRLVFSAHGTPTKYLEDGPRYEQYVRESCDQIAARLAVVDHIIGYQNHSNRPVEWTQPEIDAVIRKLDAERAVVVPISFMHEQSETLAELDIELKEVAEEAGVELYRVPIPHDDDRFIGVLADLVQTFLTGAGSKGLKLRPCQCRRTPNTLCLNAGPA